MGCKKYIKKTICTTKISFIHHIDISAYRLQIQLAVSQQFFNRASFFAALIDGATFAADSTESSCILGAHPPAVVSLLFCSPAQDGQSSRQLPSAVEVGSIMG